MAETGHAAVRERKSSDGQGHVLERISTAVNSAFNDGVAKSLKSSPDHKRSDGWSRQLDAAARATEKLLLSHVSLHVERADTVTAQIDGMALGEPSKHVSEFDVKALC